jgi:hypothetical protein
MGTYVNSYCCKAMEAKPAKPRCAVLIVEDEPLVRVTRGPSRQGWLRGFGGGQCRGSAFAHRERNRQTAESRPRLRGSPTALGRRWFGTLTLRALSPARRSPRQRTLFDGASGLLRSTAAGDWPRTLPTSLAMPWRSSVLPRSASCCENSAIHNQLSRSTLTK